MHLCHLDLHGHIFFHSKVYAIRMILGSFKVNGCTFMINPIALRMAKPLWSFGRSECNRVKNLFHTRCNLKRTVLASLIGQSLFL